MPNQTGGLVLPRGATLNDAATGQPKVVTRTDGDGLTLAYDGSLPTEARWSGEVAGMVSIGDVVKFQLGRREHEVKFLNDYIATG